MKKEITSDIIRQQFLNFFVARGHQLVPSHSLISPDPSVLFTTAGMQPFKPCFLGENCPYSSRVVSCQRCFRTSDIEEVGDISHLTFFEMLGNFSFGDYSRREAIHWALELLTKQYQLRKEKLAFTFFRGDKRSPADKETKSVLLEEGIPAEQIIALGREDNFWGPVGSSGPCGPTMEIHYEVSSEHHFPRSPRDLENRFVEVWNLVFNQYFQDEKGQLTDLPRLGIDTGMGLERLTMILEGKASVFETDLFADFLEMLKKKSGQNFRHFSSSSRIVADHLRGIIFLVADGVRPSNLGRGYILRRIIRRFIEHSENLGLGQNDWASLINWIVKKYQPLYPGLEQKGILVEDILRQEKSRLEKASQRGWKALKKLGKRKLSGEEVFSVYATYGLSPEEVKKAGYTFEEKAFQKALLEHQKASQKGKEKKFGGHGIQDAQKEPEKVKLHTATHLLQAALRKVLGTEVKQAGSDINTERLRFDFTFPRALTAQEIKAVEDWVNKRIQEDLIVQKEDLPLAEAKKDALFLEEAHYPDRVSVYTILDPKTGEIASREICAGPHVKTLSTLGHFQIIQEKSSSAGVRRIKAILQ